MLATTLSGCSALQESIDAARAQKEAEEAEESVTDSTWESFNEDNTEEEDSLVYTNQLTAVEKAIPSTEAYLANGSTVSKSIPYLEDAETGHIIFIPNIVVTDIEPDKNTPYYDLSDAGDGSVVSWIEDDTYYISSRRKGVPVYANKNSEYMFNEDSKSYVESTTSKMDLTNLDTSKVSLMDFWFSNLDVTELDLSKFDTSNVTDMSYMFWYCSNLTSLDLSSFDTSKVTNMAGMFSQCKSITELDLSMFNTSNVKDMEDMFNFMTSVTDINISSFDTAKVYDMNGMFNFCEKLKTIDISSFNTSNVQRFDSMFAFCHSLETIYVNQNPDMSKCGDNTYDMFYECNSLKGAITYASVNHDNEGPEGEYFNLNGYLTKK